MKDIDTRIAELEAVSRQREFTDEEIDEFAGLIKVWRHRQMCRERERKKSRLRKMGIIQSFLEARA